MRLDVELTNRKIFESRQRAKEAVLAGRILVNSCVCTKPAFSVTDNDVIDITGEDLKYVGRGGLKLEKMIIKHDLRFDGMTCMDIGASTGGFTDCMLQNGAEYVFAVDVGSDQLAQKLKNDSRVCNMEKTDIRNVSGESIGETMDFISVDVSFISLKLILPKVFEFLNEGAKAAVLVKPQFEAGKSKIGKNGIVKSRNVHVEVLNDITAFSRSLGFGIEDLDFSPVTGGKGNIEYLMLLVRGKSEDDYNVNKTVKNAFENLKTGGKA
ncbi:TlyA family RNA methyltransferase [Porcipelethomonas sp.]|uniref:TlyA family RNA methyltransferase n=1 Tax=Porcipelethomonas sp. TaxID=2981675 RepID=UPI003EF7BE61